MKNELTPSEMFEIIIKNLSEDGTSDLPVALEQLDKYITFYAYCVKNKISINDLDKLSNDYVAVSKEEYEYTETILKALNIIREKRVNVRCLMSGWNLGKYNSYKSHISLTEEEYDLLKEVLL